MSPLWEVLHALVPPAPNTLCVADHWKYSEVFPYLMQSGQLITAEKVVRKFGPRDHFVIPSWHTAQLRSSLGCVLFSFSDRPVHQAFGIHREERMF